VNVAKFTTLHFLQNLKMGTIGQSLHYTRQEKLDRDIQSGLLGPFINCEENEVL
jgi:hypothetical protein